MGENGKRPLLMAHISDMHVGSPHFVPNLMNRVIAEVNELQPDLVICSGDITNEGFRGEYKTAAAYIEQFQARVVAVPGNHDSKNVGYVHFEELIGPRHWCVDLRDGVRVVGVDSSEPDLNEGQVGRERYPWIIEQFSSDARLKIYVHHHHLLPVPGTGRERSTVSDAGDLLELLIRSGVDLALTGHKHVPYVWRLENLYCCNAGTCSSLRLRGHTRPAYNIIEYEADDVKIHQKHPFGPSTLLAHFNVRSHEQHYREIEPLITEQARLMS
ncbi:MAG: metallophosphoesterase [Actinomycetota bacterium]|nr:metallophosphoesterase [Actinomycetota bacterium]